MSSNVILVIIAAVVFVALLAWILASSRRTRIELDTQPAEGPARRNQALIDAPPAAVTLMPDTPVAIAALDDPAVPMPVAMAPEPAGQADDLTQIKGVGPRLAAQLNTLGIIRFAQVAAWDEADIDRIDANLGRFQGRIRRDDWPAQARLLSSGDRAGYEAKFGRL